MEGVHDSKSAVRWLEGQVISFLYGGTDLKGLTKSFQKVVSEHKLPARRVTSLIESVEQNHTVYYGGRYRLAYGAIGRRFGEVPFIEDRHRTALIHSLETVSQSLAEPV
jgi:hypothetical protein